MTSDRRLNSCALLTILICTALAGCFIPAVRAAEPEIVDVFAGLRDGYPAYRIPSLALTTKGSLIAITEARQAGKDLSLHKLLYKRSTDGGRTWSAVMTLAEAGEGTCNDTSTVVCSQANRVISLYTVYPAGTDEAKAEAGYAGKVAHHFAIRSDDDGLTWSTPMEIRMVRRPEVKTADFAPGAGLELRRPPHAGRLLVPMWQSYRGGTFAVMVMSDDRGETWRLGEDVFGYGPKEAKRGINESQVVELADGRILLTGRGWDIEMERKTSDSSDGGQTWSRLEDTASLVDPHCQAGLVRYSDPLDGRRSRLLFGNAAHPKNRENGTVRLSYDEGATWPVARVLVPGAFGYSCLTRLPDGNIGLLFENRAGGSWHLSFARFSLAWLTGGQNDGSN